MHILQAHKFFYPRGGAEVIFFETIEGLRDRGHEVSEFSMHHPKNLASAYSRYFVSELPELSGPQTFGESWKSFRRLFYSAEVETNLTELIKIATPQIAHLHNVYHHLSASLFKTLKKNKIPIVLTVHDVQPMCPNHRMMRGTDDTLCERCYRHCYYNCLRYRCINRSLTRSAAGALEAYYYYLNSIWFMVDRFICPSHFIMDKLVAWGFPKEKMRLLPNPYRVPAEVLPLGNVVLFMGRLHREKGLKVLLEAAKILREVNFVIAGTGPEEKYVDDFIIKNSLLNVRRVGFVSAGKWQEEMSRAKIVTVPSNFYEICSVTVLEAMGAGRLVVASDRGGNTEMIRDGVNGFLIKPEDPAALVWAIRRAYNLPRPEEMGAAARHYVQTYHSEEKYFSDLLKIYAELV